MEKTIEIPEGYEARIEGNKVIIVPKESEDERIRKGLVKMISGIDGGYPFEKYGIVKKDALAYLEKQKEAQPGDEDRYMVGYMNGMNDAMKEQQPAEWSEEEKMHFANAILAAEKEWGANSYTARFLEALRDNYKKYNSRWKPSEEQQEESVGVAESPSKTFPRINEFDCGSSYRH